MHSYCLCIVLPKYGPWIVTTPRSRAARQSYTWATRASDENRLGAFKLVRPVFSCFRVGCIASSTCPPHAWPCFVGRDQGHSFAPLVVLPRRVLTALHLLLGAKSRRFRYEPVSSCFRVGCTARSAFPPRAWPRLVGGDRGHSFAPLMVLPRRVLTALHLLLGAKSHRISGTSPIPRVSASAAQPVVHSRPALGLALLAATEGIRLRR